MYNKYDIENTLKTLHILYIEDEDPIRKSITKVLKCYSDHVLSIASAEEAKEIYEDFQADIVICDINLSGISGISFVKWIREFDDTTHIFLLTAYTDKEYLLEAVKLKLVDYLVKPIDLGILEDVLKKITKNIINMKKLNIRFISGAEYSNQQCTVKFNEHTYNLRAKEVLLLDYLISKKTRMTSKDELNNYLWDYDMASDSAFKSLMNKLRSKVGKESIKNISGIGYQILLDES